MEFLKAIIGDALYGQIETKVNEFNTKETDKDKQVKVVNVNDGEYVSKSKYTSLETDLTNTKTSLDTANTTITDLKKTNGSNADLQAKITTYEAEKATKETEYKEATAKLRKEQAVKDVLYSEKAKHPELLLSKFDLSKIVLDENGEKVVSGIDEQMKSNKETYKDLFGEESQSTYRYSPQSGNQGQNSGASDFVGIIKENQARKI